MRVVAAVFVLISFFSFTVSGQEGDSTKTRGQSQMGDSTKNQGQGRMEISEIVAKPAFEATNGGFHMRVWVMAAIKDMNEELNNQVSDELKTGTHNIMVEVTDAENKKELPGALVNVLIISPSEKEAKVELKPMMNHYGGNITLDEKGDYQLNVSVTVNGESTLTPFKYTVQ